VLTIVWARRFAEYKRPGLLKKDFERFRKLVERDDRPLQVIWAGKPYPFDSNAINLFNELIDISHHYKRVAVLTGYELELSRVLKKGSDIWLNTPRVSREASGTSGMSASMNGTIHFSTNDGWHPEFAIDGLNCFTIPQIDHSTPTEVQDREDNMHLMDILEHQIIPLYYDHPEQWTQMMKRAMSDVIPKFDSGRMVHEYYDKMYNLTVESEQQ
jgi:starch phosphorylase